MTALAAWSIVKRFWWAIPLAGLLLYATLEHRSAVHNLAGWQGEKDAHAQTIANVKAAADEAARIDKANVARVQTEQTAITERVTNDYESKLADSASRYDRLRAQASGYLSRAGTAGVPASPDTTCQAVTGTRCEELPALLKAAQDNTDQLLALQDWVRAQSKVDVGNGSNP